jgi:SAM-dependent methyltransferase
MPRRGDTVSTVSDLKSQYADGRNLRARQSIWAYGESAPLPERVLDLVGLDGGETVVDVGCGNGGYEAALRRRGHRGPVLGCDLSPGMAAEASAYAPCAAADAQALPVRAGVADVALAPHMLYHVPDIPRAIAELRRVVRSGGVAMVVTNGAGHRREVTALVRAATGRSQDWDGGRFDAAVAAALLPAAFGTVTPYDLGQTVCVPDPAAVTAFVASVPPAALGLGEGQAYRAAIAAVDAAARAHVATHGTFEVTSAATAFLCT